MEIKINKIYRTNKNYRQYKKIIIKNLPLDGLELMPKSDLKKETLKKRGEEHQHIQIIHYTKKTIPKMVKKGGRTPIHIKNSLHLNKFKI